MEKGIGGKVIQVREGARIENPREYESGAIKHLRQLLEAGSPAQLDARRENFYEIEGCCENYYIHISPVSGNVVLLAKWLRQSEDCCLGAGHFIA
jgi:hypothetical protein